MDCAKKWLTAFNQDCQVTNFDLRIDELSVTMFDSIPGLIVDCSDNIETRYLINDYCASTGRPFIHASIQQSAFLLALFNPQQKGCLRCYFPEAAYDLTPSCSVGGTLGAWTGIVGAWQAQLAIKMMQNPHAQTQLYYGDIQTGRVQPIDLPKTQSSCALCQCYKAQGQIAAKDMFQNLCEVRHVNEITINQLKKNLSEQDYSVIDVRDADERNTTDFINSIHIAVNGLDKSQFIASFSKQNTHITHSKSQNYLVVCATGIRSKRCARWLNEAFGNGIFSSLKGGVEKLTAKELETLNVKQEARYGYTAT